MYRIILSIICALAVLSCQGSSVGGPDSGRGSGKPVVHIERWLVDADNRFGFALLDELAKADSGGNLFISPASVTFALTMTYNGAAGETRSAMARTLELQGHTLDEVNRANAELRELLVDPDTNVQLAIANSLWARIGVPFDSAFLARDREFFAAQVRTLDFNLAASADTINRWVSDQTRDRIKEIVTAPIDPLTIMFLINAIYFKGTWTYQFDPTATKPASFFLADGREKTLSFMNQSGTYRYLRGDGFQAVCLPYSTGRMGMYVFLPDFGVGLAQFLAVLNAETWEDWMSRFAKADGDLWLPRFQLEYEETLNDALSSLGMDVAFTDHADFSAMTPWPAVISRVKHKTFLDVNEEGTEAAAVTSVEVGTTAYPSDRFNMRVNRPFFCAIRDDSTGVVLFMGAVNEPM